ncbi:MAG: MFS transporter [Candidatus Hodarchaeales archaeon]
MTPIKDYNKAIWIAGLGTVLATFQLVIIGNYVVIFLKEDLLTAIIIITIIVSLRNFLQLFLRVPLGDLSQIIGRKPLILAGHFSLTISLLLMFLADSWIWVLISTIFVSIGMSAFWPCLLAYISDFSPENSSGGLIGRIFQMADLGSVIGSLIASIVLDELLWELTDLFGLAALIAFLFGLVNILILPEGLDKERRKQVSSIPIAIANSFSSMLSSLKQMTLTKDLSQAYCFQLILSFTEFTATTFLPLLIVQKGYSRGDVSEIGLWAILGSVWFKQYLGRMTDRYKFIYVITITIMIYSIALLAFTIVQNFLLLVILSIIMNASLITAYMAENNEVSKRAPFAFRGTALGALGFYVSLGRTSSTIISGPIWEIIGLTGIFYGIIFGVIVITLILFFFIEIKTLNQ